MTSNHFERLKDRISRRDAVVGVIGLGYVGLPLAIEFAKAGFRVVGFDISDRVVGLLIDGKSHIQDVAAADVASLVAQGLFEATTDERRLAEVDAISIAVPTPLSKTRDPDMSYVVAAAHTVARQLRAGTLVVLESTTYPGTTREVLAPALENKGLVVGDDVFVAFSPERVDPGNLVYHTKNTPKVVGGITRACVEVATALYETCIDRVIPVSSPEAAELVKLLENTFRAVNIGLVNEMAIVCDKLGIDVWEVIDAAGTKPFGFMKFTPGPGIGGHCIPLDPHYLAWKMRSLNYKTRFIDLASEINSRMPAFIVEKIAYALNADRRPVNGSKVLVIGVAYKRDIDDLRESPALDVIRLLEEQGAEVSFHDPHIHRFREDSHGGYDADDGCVREGVDLTPEVLTASDVVAILTDHTAVNYELVRDFARVIVDSRNAMRRFVSESTHSVPFGSALRFEGVRASAGPALGRSEREYEMA